jgi:hypothetical protein
LTADVTFINEAPKTASFLFCDRRYPETAGFFTGPTVLFVESKDLAYLPGKYVPSARACFHHKFGVNTVVVVVVVTLMNKM